MPDEFTFRIGTTPFDEAYTPSDDSRITTNFANLARGPHRRQNLRNALDMIDRRFNELAHEDNPHGDRYAVEIEIVSASLEIPGDDAFPLLEVLDLRVLDRVTGGRHAGIVGNNFSSYVRDFDFSVRLPASGSVPDDFGDLHGALFRRFVDSVAYRERFTAAPVICISVSTSRTYRRSAAAHPVLGVEYHHDASSLTDAYFAKMGLQVRYFMPPGAVAPLAFYFAGDLLGDYSALQLIGTISTMETFQKIYRPEIYNAHSAAAGIYRPTLEHAGFSRTRIDYDREERSRLARSQGRYAAEHLVKRHGDALARWASASDSSLVAAR